MLVYFIGLMVTLGLVSSADPLPLLLLPAKKGSYPSPKPSDFPSRKPTKVPRIRKSSKPSSKILVATTLPSVPPKEKLPSSSVPSNTHVQSYPSKHPTSKRHSGPPSSKPSDLGITPSKRPFIRITSKPSSKPVAKPSHRPSIKLSFKPSRRPSIRFSLKPSFKSSSMSLATVVKPSKRPSRKTLYVPSSTPSSFQGLRSSMKPSKNSKENTTSLPTGYPIFVTRPSAKSRSPSVRSNRPVAPPTSISISKGKSKAPIAIEQSIKPVRSLRPSISYSAHKNRTVRPSKNAIDSLSSKAPTKTSKITTVSPTTRDSQSFSALSSHAPTITPSRHTGNAFPPSSISLSNASLPKFLLVLYLNASNAGSLRKLQTIGTQTFHDSELTDLVESALLRGSSSEISATNVSVSLLSPSILTATANKSGSNSAMVLITCKYSGFVYFVDNATTISTKTLGQWILQVFGTSPSVDEFISNLHEANNAYLQTVKSVKVQLLTDSSSSNLEAINATRNASRLPYIVVGSVLSVIILSVATYFVFKNKKVAGYKSTNSIPCTPDLSPGDDEELEKEIISKKNTTLLGIEAKDVYIENSPKVEDYVNDSLSTICMSLTRILEERGMPLKDNDIQPTRTSLGKMFLEEETTPPTTEDLTWTLIPNPDSKSSYDENDARMCCVYNNPMENESARRIFNTALTSNPLYHEFIQQDPMKDFIPKDTPPNAQVPLTLTPMPKNRCDSFDMRNRDEAGTTLEEDDEEEEKSNLFMCGLTPTFPKIPSPRHMYEENLTLDSSKTEPLSPRFTLDTKLSYEEYGVKNCCNLDSELKNRLFGNVSL